MTAEEAFIRRAIVFGSAVVYWAGVWAQAQRIRKKIHKSPNLKPRGLKEKILWAGWFLVIVAWMSQPVLIGRGVHWWALKLSPLLLQPFGLILGLALTVAGYIGTLWCYASMGDTWRIGIDRTEKTPLVTRGPYRSVRHPIYLFQIVILSGAAFLLPSPLSLIVLIFHSGCAWIKAADEESFLVTVHGNEYRDYASRTGRLFPRLFSK